MITLFGFLMVFYFAPIMLLFAKPLALKKSTKYGCCVATFLNVSKNNLFFRRLKGMLNNLRYSKNICENFFFKLLHLSIPLIGLKAFLIVQPISHQLISRSYISDNSLLSIGSEITSPPTFGCITLRSLRTCPSRFYLQLYKQVFLTNND